MVRRIRTIKPRKGLGKGKGKGYKNIIRGYDSKVHTDSAKGRKQPQRVNMLPEPAMTKTDAEQELVDALDMQTLREIEEELSQSIESFNEDEDGVYRFETDLGEEYYLFESEDKAEEFAKERVRQDLEDEPSLFNQDWLQNFMTISDTDRRLIAGEEADNLVDEVYDEEEILNEENGELQERWNELNDLKESAEDALAKDPTSKDAEKLQQKIDDFEAKQEKIVEEAKESVRESEYDRIYEELDDPIRYFVDEQGIYSREELLKQNFISIDVDEATDQAIAVDGWQHFIPSYDGGSIDLPSGKVLVRLN